MIGSSHVTMPSSFWRRRRLEHFCRSIMHNPISSWPAGEAFEVIWSFPVTEVDRTNPLLVHFEVNDLHPSVCHSARDQFAGATTVVSAGTSSAVRPRSTVRSLHVDLTLSTA